MLGLMSEGDEHLPSQLRDAEIAPERRPLAEVLERLPSQPGVYLMKDRRGKMLYIGKAANLRNRVRQYFQPASGDTRYWIWEDQTYRCVVCTTRNARSQILVTVGMGYSVVMDALGMSENGAKEDILKAARILQNSSTG